VKKSILTEMGEFRKYIFFKEKNFENIGTSFGCLTGQQIHFDRKFGCYQMEIYELNNAI
jgi:hypothetical protein